MVLYTSIGIKLLGFNETVKIKTAIKIIMWKKIVGQVNIKTHFYNIVQYGKKKKYSQFKKKFESQKIALDSNL